MAAMFVRVLASRLLFLPAGLIARVVVVFAAFAGVTSMAVVVQVLLGPGRVASGAVY